MSRLIPPDSPGHDRRAHPDFPPDATELEALSAYLDNALPEAERAAFEQRLNAEPALQTRLESLRRTVAVLESAPVLAPPRDFRLDPAQYRRPASRPRRNLWLPVGVIGAAAAVFLVALVAGGGLLINTSSAPGQVPRSVAINPTLAPPAAGLSTTVPTAKAGISESAGAVGPASPLPESPTVSRSASADQAVQSPRTPTNFATATLAASTATAAEITQAAAVPPVFFSPTISGANSGIAAPPLSASKAAGGSAGPVSAQVAASSLPATPTPFAMLAAQPTSAPANSSVVNKLTTLWDLIRWLLALFGLKGLS